MYANFRLVSRYFFLGWLQQCKALAGVILRCMRRCGQGQFFTCAAVAFLCLKPRCTISNNREDACACICTQWSSSHLDAWLFLFRMLTFNVKRRRFVTPLEWMGAKRERKKSVAARAARGRKRRKYVKQLSCPTHSLGWMYQKLYL